MFNVNNNGGVANVFNILSVLQRAYVKNLGEMCHCKGFDFTLILESAVLMNSCSRSCFWSLFAVTDEKIYCIFVSTLLHLA